MTRLKSSIAPPTDVIEASVSPAPDDVSRVYIRIEATSPDDAMEGWSLSAGEIEEIRFEIAVAASDEEDKDKLRNALTRNPRSINPVAEAFGRWTFSSPEEGGIFIARPDLVPGSNDSEPLLKKDEVLVFYLRDVEVVDRDGVTEIKVCEVPEDGDQTTETIPIRKTFPGLRIDYFVASSYSIDSDESVELSWATTGASDIKLIDQNGRSIIENPTDPNWRDGKKEVNPQTTSTYTLIASNNNVDAVATQQATIAVTDQFIANLMAIAEAQVDEISGPHILIDPYDAKLLPEVGDQILFDDVERNIIKLKFGSHSRLTITVDEPLPPDIKTPTIVKFRRTGAALSVTSETLDVAGRIKDKTGYVMPVGSIIAYAGKYAPEGWLICDGSDKSIRDFPDLYSVIGHTYGISSANFLFKMPDLSDRFVVGVGEKYEEGDKGGKNQVKLEIIEMPTHNHSVYTKDSGEHKHKVGVRGFNTGSEGIGADGSVDKPYIETINDGRHTHSIQESYKGGDRPHENRPPYLALNHIIKY